MKVALLEKGFYEVYHYVVEDEPEQAVQSTASSLVEVGGGHSGGGVTN